MAFGLYVHIPHCRQVCPYCDFTKYELGKILSPERYVELLLTEIRDRSSAILARTERRVLSSLYFGGGTPSLLEPKSILRILEELANQGFTRSTDCEFTIEINPGTLTDDKLRGYLDLGINRFSVGVQTFDEVQLARLGRKHNVNETIETLQLLKSQNTNVSLDLLFATPSQTLDDLKADLNRALDFSPQHISAYYLTLPDQHPLSRGRPPEEEQLKMFDLIETTLGQNGLERYEISSYARPGFESKHNFQYWSDQEYWGIGVSAHSYLHEGPWGLRFWNATALPAYVKQIEIGSRAQRLGDILWAQQFEQLERHQALTDDCHVGLRKMKGLSGNALRLKYGGDLWSEVHRRLLELQARGLVSETDQTWCLSRQGKRLANLVFAELTFLASELKSLD